MPRKIEAVEFWNYGEKKLPDGRVLSVDPLTFGRARLCIATAEGYGYFYEDGW